MIKQWHQKKIRYLRSEHIVGMQLMWSSISYLISIFNILQNGGKDVCQALMISYIVRVQIQNKHLDPIFASCPKCIASSSTSEGSPAAHFLQSCLPMSTQPCRQVPYSSLMYKEPVPVEDSSWGKETDRTLITFGSILVLGRSASMQLLKKGGCGTLRCYINQ